MTGVLKHKKRSHKTYRRDKNFNYFIWRAHLKALARGKFMPEIKEV